jgi:hypothetical protein
VVVGASVVVVVVVGASVVVVVVGANVVVVVVGASVVVVVVGASVVVVVVGANVVVVVVGANVVVVVVGAAVVVVVVPVAQSLISPYTFTSSCVYKKVLGPIVSVQKKPKPKAFNAANIAGKVGVKLIVYVLPPITILKTPHVISRVSMFQEYFVSAFIEYTFCFIMGTLISQLVLFCTLNCMSSFLFCIIYSWSIK